MWWRKKADDKKIQIRAQLKDGETLHIAFSHEARPGDLDIQGSGEIRLAVRAPREIRAEVVPAK